MSRIFGAIRKGLNALQINNRNVQRPPCACELPCLRKIRADPADNIALIGTFNDDRAVR